MATVYKTHKIYTDQTKKFPMTPSQGNNYVIIIIVYDANTILAEPIKSRSSSHIMELYTNQVKQLTNRGYIPRVHYMENEASANLKKYN